MVEGTQALADELFDRTKHNRESFDCGSPDLNTFLRRYAAQQNDRDVAVVRVLVDRAQPSSVLGFYSLSPAVIEGRDVDYTTRSGTPSSAVSCFRLGRLATNVLVRGEGFGRFLVGLAVARCLNAATKVNAYALVVNAKDDAARGFFLHYGFSAARQSPGALYLPLRSMHEVSGANV